MVIWIVPQEVLTVKISWTLYGKHNITNPLTEITAACFIVYKYIIIFPSCFTSLRYLSQQNETSNLISRVVNCYPVSLIG